MHRRFSVISQRVSRNARKVYFWMNRGVSRAGAWCHKTVDLLDVTLCASFSLITSGVYMLWGTGWACIVLGTLLLLLILVGLPSFRKDTP